MSVSTRTPREDWTEPLVLAESEEILVGTRASVAPDGGMLVIWWAANDDGSTRLEAVLRSPDGEWDEPFTAVEDMGYNDPLMDVVLGSGMNGSVVWRDDCFPPNPDLIFDTNAVILDGGQFGEVEKIPDSACQHTYPALAIDDSGRTLAAVNGFGSDFVVKLAVREPGESFGPAEQLNPDGEDAFQAVTLATPDGETAIVWGRARRSGRLTGVRAALGDAEGMGRARVISGGTGRPTTMPGRRPAMNAAGDVAVLVARFQPTRRLVAVYRDGDRARFERPEFVTGPMNAGSIQHGALAMGPGGQPTAAWKVRDTKRGRRHFMFAERRAKRR